MKHSVEDVYVSQHAKCRFFQRIDNQLNFQDSEQLILSLYSRSDHLPSMKISGMRRQPSEYSTRMVRYMARNDMRYVVFVIRFAPEMNRDVITTVFSVKKSGKRLCPDKSGPIL